MLAYSVINFQCVMLHYSEVNSNGIVCGGNSSVTLNFLLDETHTSVFLRHIGPGTETEYSCVWLRDLLLPSLYWGYAFRTFVPIPFCPKHFVTCSSYCSKSADMATWIRVMYDRVHTYDARKNVFHRKKERKQIKKILKNKKLIIQDA
jgi:hypothetical protein